MDLSPVVLEGARVRLEPLTRDHYETLYEIGTDPELWAWTTRAVETAEDMRVYLDLALQWQAEGTCIPFVIVDKATGRIIGSTRFHEIAPKHKRVEIGYTWLTKSCQGTGINGEIKSLMLDYAFDVLGCNRVEFRADSKNLPSRRALEKIGAKEEALLRNYIVSKDRGIRDVAVYGILAEEWKAQES